MFPSRYRRLILRVPYKTQLNNTKTPLESSPNQRYPTASHKTLQQTPQHVYNAKHLLLLRIKGLAPHVVHTAPGATTKCQPMPLIASNANKIMSIRTCFITVNVLSNIQKQVLCKFMVLKSFLKGSIARIHAKRVDTGMGPRSVFSLGRGMDFLRRTILYRCFRAQGSALHVKTTIQLHVSAVQKDMD